MPYHTHKIGDILGLRAALDNIIAWVIGTFVPAGYGGITLSAPDLAFPDLGAGWVTLNADSQSVDPMHGVTADLPNDALIFDVEGVWQVSVGFTIEHDESQQSRTIYARFWNLTNAAAPLTPVPVGIGRNIEVTSFNVIIFFTVPADSIGDSISIQIGGGSNVIVDALNSYNFNVNYVSEYQGPPPAA